MRKEYRGFWRFRDYQRYEIGLHVVDRTGGFGVFAITNGIKLDCAWPIIPWVFAFSRLPTVENGDLRRPEHRGFLRFCNYQR